jgi:hypothetical protein
MKMSQLTVRIPVPSGLFQVATIPISIAKEIRAILPTFLCGLALALFAAVPMGNWIGSSIFLIYPLVCAAIGAQAFGHDYTHRTLASFLALPLSRSRVWWMRLGLAFLAMLPLAILFIAFFFRMSIWATLSGHKVFFAEPQWPIFLHYVSIAASPMLAGLFLAPWLTLVSRSALFGTIVSMAAPYLLLLVWTSVRRAVGYDEPDTWWFPLGLVPMIGLSLLFGILGWRKFHRLEVFDGQIAVSSRSVAAVAAAQKIRPQSAITQLVKKDLMILRTPILIATVGMLITLCLPKEQAALWTFAYPAIVILLAGSIASAEEHQLGVAEWQILIPIAFWKQWTIKIVVTWLTAFIFGLVLPVAALFLKTGELEKLFVPAFLPDLPVFIAASFGFTIVTLYLSTLCRSSLKALIASIFVNIFIASIAIKAFGSYSKYLGTEGVLAASDIWNSSLIANWWTHWQYAPFLLALSAFLTLALTFGMRNHRYAERGIKRILRQTSAFGLCAAATTFTIYTFWNWYTWLR